MRFPLRLSAALFKAKMYALVADSNASPILHVSPSGDGLARTKILGAPVVWVGGEEPLLHPEIGRFANDLLEENRHVFLHTDGYDLRQRIHAFRPDPRLFLTLEFRGRQETHNLAVGRPDAFRRSLDGIRAAKLSGFLVAAHFTITSETDPCEIGELIEFLDNKDVDGFVVSAGGQVAGQKGVSFSETLADARAMIRGSRWENFSRLLENSYAAAPTRAREKVSPPGEGVYEEGD